MNQIFTIYHVEYVGVNQRKTIGYYRDNAEALKAAKGKGWYKSNADITPIWVTEIGGDYYQVVNSPIKLNK